MNLIKIATAVGNLLKEKKLMLATAESCSGGGIAQAITAIAGSSEWFDRGYVTYSNQAKCEMLAVEPQLIDMHGAVSEQTALAMANGVLRQCSVDIAVSVTGIAGPGGATVDKPVGTVWFAIASRQLPEWVKCQHFSGNRAQIRQQAVEYILSQLLRYCESG